LNHVEAVMGIEKALQRTHALVRESKNEVETLSIGEAEEEGNTSKLYNDYISFYNLMPGLSGSEVQLKVAMES